jgi:hypothetical protein
MNCYLNAGTPTKHPQQRLTLIGRPAGLPQCVANHSLHDDELRPRDALGRRGTMATPNSVRKRPIYFASAALGAIREALGQIIEYNLY